MSEPLRYIIVGTGGYGAHWCKDVLPRLRAADIATPVAAVDINPDKHRLAQEFLGLPEKYCYTDAAEAFQTRRSDFAIIVTPTVTHEKMVDLALTFDQHILLQGPVADTIESACRIYRKARGVHKRKVAVVLNTRYEQNAQTLLNIVKNHRFGRLGYVVATFTDACRKKNSWGRMPHEMNDPLLTEASMSHFDLFRGLAEENAKSVYALSWNPPWGEYRGDSTALVTVEMLNGIHGLYEGAKANASSLRGPGDEYFRAECEYGTLELDQGIVRLTAGGGQGGSPRTEIIPMLDQPCWGDAWLAEMFCHWLAGAIEPPNTLKDHMFTAATSFAAIQSARLGKVVDVKEFLHERLEASRLPSSHGHRV